MEITGRLPKEAEKTDLQPTMVGVERSALNLLRNFPQAM